MTHQDPKILNEKWYEATLQATLQIGLYAIKTLIALNSGAFVVLLTFLGNAAAQTKFSVELSSIKVALSLFLVGLTCAGVVTAFAYYHAVKMSPYSSGESKLDQVSLPFYMIGSFFSFAAFIVGVGVVIFGAHEALQ